MPHMSDAGLFSVDKVDENRMVEIVSNNNVDEVLFDTSRLTVRKVSPADIDKIRPILSDKVTMQYTATGALDFEQSVKFIENCIYQYNETGFGYWVIVITETKELVGLCGLNIHEVDSEEYLHVNYRLGSQYHGKGFATETVNGVKEFCSKNLTHDYLSAIIEISNINSINVIERSGFKFVKRTRFKDLDVNIYQAGVSSEP